MTESLEFCLFGCVGATTTTPPACGGPQEGELLIDQPGPLRTPSGLWPNPLIPVCWRNTDATSSNARAIRERIDTTWGRFSSVGFPGWGECDDASTGVELRFVEDCEGELARVPFLGYPGPSVTLPIDLCISYRDSEGSQNVGEGLLGFVALHVFGHVLGFEDLRLDRD
ncbi:MAG TPA: hypothetical protein VFZ53_01720, partial [Polyangiaceae bacterium]